MRWGDSDEKSDGGSTGVQLERRQFLGLLVGGAAQLALVEGLVGCGDADDPTLEGGTTSGPMDGDDTGLLTTTAPDDGESSGSTAPEGSDSTGDAEETGDEPVALPFDPNTIPEDTIRFPLAVLSGEMKPETAMLAVWVADSLPKMLRVWTNDGQEMVAAFSVTPDENGYVKVIVPGLRGGTWYKYAFFTGPEEEPTGRSLIGEFRTALADDALEPLTFAISACNGESFNWPALDRMSDEYFDAFLHLGDMAYCDGATTREEFRNHWRQYLGSDGFRRILARSGTYITWDDHEITDNGKFDRETMDPSELQKRQNAFDAFYETLPIDTSKTGYRLWRSFRWGLTAEIIVLDSRYERQPSLGKYMSDEQMAFLKDRLKNSPCHFKVVMNSVPITNMPFAWDVAKGDRWEGFDSRQELLTFINQNDIQNVWFVAGDFHVCFVSRLGNDNDLASNIREIAVTGGKTNPVPDTLLALNPPQFDYGVTLARGCILTFDPIADSVNVRFLHPDSGNDAYAADLKYPGH